MEGIKCLSEKNGVLILDFTGIFMASQKTVGKDIDRSHPPKQFWPIKQYWDKIRAKRFLFVTSHLDHR